jgi:hypothetical protein
MSRRAGPISRSAAHPVGTDHDGPILPLMGEEPLAIVL